jgi:hypothetical protein
VNPIFSHVGYGNDDEGLDQFLADQSLSGFIDAPLNSGKGCGRIENVLAIMKVKDWVTPTRKPTITGRQVNKNVTSIPEDLGPEISMMLDISG